MEKVIIWGIGAHAYRVLMNSRVPLENIIAFIDSSKEKQGAKYFGKPVLDPSELEKYKPCVILVGTTKYYKEICSLLCDKHSVNLEDIRLLDTYVKDYPEQGGFTNDYYKSNNILSWIKEKNNKSELKDLNIELNKIGMSVTRCLRNPYRHDQAYDATDLIRRLSIELAAKEIYERRIMGEVAELGFIGG